MKYRFAYEVVMPFPYQYFEWNQSATDPIADFSILVYHEIMICTVSISKASLVRKVMIIHVLLNNPFGIGAIRLLIEV